MGAPVDPETSPPGPLSMKGVGERRAPRWAGPVAFLLVLVGLLGGLEGLARVYVQRFAPTRLRDGVYLNRLPLVTGITPGAFQGAAYPGDPLPEAKAPGELRVAVIGESSVEGSPFSPHASAPTMLHDRLRELLPGRAVTVLNLGRVGSIAANAWYTLVWLRRYAPDVVILYLGYNDTPDLGGEQCWAAEHPDAHAAWRRLVRHSWLVWAARAAGPAYLSKLTDAAKGYHPQHRDTPCPAPAFPPWARWLVEAAVETGARVVVTTPLHSPLAHLEPGLAASPDGRNDPAALRPAYAALLRCRLTPGCDLGPGLDAEGPALTAWKAERARMDGDWRQAAGTDAAVLDVAADLGARGPGGPWGIDLFLDEIHLTLEGYAGLATRWAEAVRAIAAGGRVEASAEPAPLDLARYRADCRYVSTGVALNFFARGWYLSALPLMQLAAAWCPQGRCDPAAPLAVAWLRKGLGLEPGVPAEQAPAVEAFAPLDWLK